MRISRRFTQTQADPFAGIAFKRVDVEAFHPDPAERVCLTDIEVPAHWSYEAAQLFAKHYLTREAIPSRLKKVAEANVPAFLQRSVPDHEVLSAMRAAERETQETSAKQVFKRLAGALSYNGFKAGYFDTVEDAQAFHDEMCAVLAKQLAAPNSLQWRQNGIYWAYGIEGDAVAGFVIDPATNKLAKAESAYVHPQLHACVLNSVKHNTTNEDALLALIERERRVMTLGASSGCYFPAGGKEGGLLRAISLRDKAMHTIAAHGVPRKPGAMAVVDVEHPECDAFLRFTAEEHYKATALMVGSKMLRHHLMQILAAAQSKEGPEPSRNAALKAAIMQAQWALVPLTAIERILAYVRAGFTEIQVPVYNAEVGSGAFASMAAHNSKLALRLSDLAMQAWQHEPRAQEQFDEWAHSAWATGEPALMFKDAVQDWHGCQNAGEVKSTTAGMEFLFVEDTALPLASINLAAFVTQGGFDIAGLRQVAKLMTLALEISVASAHYPTRDMARMTSDTRPLGLSVTGLAEVLMALGLAYGSEEGCATGAAIMGIITAEAYATSAVMAKDTGPFAQFASNRVAMTKLLQTHRQLAMGQTVTLASGRECVGLAASLAPEFTGELQRAWDQAIMWAEAYGLRNAQVTCIAPMASVTRLMDTHTIGIAPAQKLVFHAPQANAGVRKYIHPVVTSALKRLGYSASQIADISAFLTGSGRLADEGVLSRASLRAKGFGAAEIARVEAALVGAASLEDAFDPWHIGERFCRTVLKLSDKDMFDDGFSLLRHMEFTPLQIADADVRVCGSKTMCGAPHLKNEHLAVFATLRTAALADEREVSAEAQIRMMAAMQKFVSGGISHVVNLPFDATMGQFNTLAKLAFVMGLKTVSLTRYACQLYTAQLPESLHEIEQKPMASAKVQKHA